MKYQLVRSKQFEKSFAKLYASGRLKKNTIAKFNLAVNLLRDGNVLPRHFRDHQLKGNKSHLREFHLQGDLLVLYRVDGDIVTITVMNIGSHSQLFE